MSYTNILDLSTRLSFSDIGETARQIIRTITDYKGSDKHSAILHHVVNCEPCQNSKLKTQLWSTEAVSSR